MEDVSRHRVGVNDKPQLGKQRETIVVSLENDPGGGGGFQKI